MRPRPSAISAELLGHSFRFETQSGLFSADRIDDGTRLLLDALPSAPAPGRILDLGCGYGALGLPVAKAHPQAHCLMVDRNTLAVSQAAHNAAAHALGNVNAMPSLGFRDIAPDPFDWILCNVPARIGAPALRYFIDEGTRRLTEKGSLRIVVIRDLTTTVEDIAAQSGWAVERILEGARHTVLAFPRRESHEPSPDPETPYLRDEVSIGELTFERPFDISEDPTHFNVGLPLLLELLPRSLTKRALLWRCGYGAVASTLAARGAAVIAADPDLLQTTFTRRNAERQKQWVETREAPRIEALPSFAPARLFVGEIPAALDREAAGADVVASLKRVERGADVLWLGLTQSTKPLLEKLHARRSLRFIVLATREPFTLWRITPPA